MCEIRLARHRDRAVWFAGDDVGVPEVRFGRGMTTTTKAWVNDGSRATVLGLPVLDEGQEIADRKSHIVGSIEGLVGWLDHQGFAIDELVDRYEHRSVGSEDLWDLYPPDNCVVEIDGKPLPGYQWHFAAWTVAATVWWKRAAVALVRK